LFVHRRRRLDQPKSPSRAGGGTIQATAAASPLTLSGAIAKATTNDLRHQRGNITVSGVIGSGNGGLTKTARHPHPHQRQHLSEPPGRSWYLGRQRSVTSNVTVTTPAILNGIGTITGDVSGNGTFSPGNGRAS